jgi:hypothetical protein
MFDLFELSNFKLTNNGRVFAKAENSLIIRLCQSQILVSVIRPGTAADKRYVDELIFFSQRRRKLHVGRRFFLI